MLLDLARKPLHYSSYLATFEPSHRLIVQKQGLDSDIVDLVNFGRISQRTSLEASFAIYHLV